LLAAEDRSPLPDGVTFHSLRRTYTALRAELGEHPAIAAAQMGHRDPRMTHWAPVPNQPEARRTRQPPA
jgi:integrase